MIHSICSLCGVTSVPTGSALRCALLFEAIFASCHKPRHIVSIRKFNEEINGWSGNLLTLFRIAFASTYAFTGFGSPLSAVSQEAVSITKGPLDTSCQKR